MIENEIKIGFPISEKDYEELILLISKTLVFDKNLTKEYYQSLSVGEILFAQAGGKVIGVIVHRRPGRIFSELPDEHFALNRIKYDKPDLGYVAIIVVDAKVQGKGVGKKLVKEALKYQEEWGSKAVLVHCWQSSPGGASERLFSSLGFEPLKVHKQPWHEYAKEVGPKGHLCVACGNPCICDELEMVKYLN